MTEQILELKYKRWMRTMRIEGVMDYGSNGVMELEFNNWIDGLR